MPTQDGIELRWIFNVIRRWLWLILVCALLAAGIAFLFTSWMPPVYNANVTILVEPSEDLKTGGYNDLVAGERLAITYSQMVTGRSILEEVISRLGLNEIPSTLAKKISSQPIENTQLIQISVQDSSPTQAALLANTVAEVLTSHIQSLQTSRYTASIEDMQQKLEELSTQIVNTTSQIDSLNASSIEKGAELDRQKSLLQGYRDDYRALQQGYQSLQLTVNQLTDKIHIVEAAQVRPAGDLEKNSIATSTLLVEQSLITGSNAYSIPASAQLLDTYGQMMMSPSLVETVISRLGLSKDPASLAGKVQVKPINGTQLVRLSVTDSSPQQAKLMADTLAEIYVNQIQALLAKPYTDRLAVIQKQIDGLAAQIEQSQTEIETLTAEKSQADTQLPTHEILLTGFRNDYQTLQQDYEQIRLNAVKASNAVIIVDQARVPEIPLQRNLLYISLAAVVGLMLGIGLAFLVEQLNDRIRTSQDVSEKLGMVTLGTIGKIAKGDNELVIDSQPTSYLAEAFRVLGTNIRLSNIGKPVRVLVVTSPARSEGKSVVAANLAVALAKTGVKVIAVDADLRLPRLHKIFEAEQKEGLTGSLLNGSVAGCLQPTKFEGLQLLPSGLVPPDSSELISSPQVAMLLDELAQLADYVIIDTPPLLTIADATILASKSDGVLLVLASGHTSSQAVREAIGRLQQVGSRLIGVVLNGMPGHMNEYYQHYGYKTRAPAGILKRWHWSLSGSTRPTEKS